MTKKAPPTPEKPKFGIAYVAKQANLEEATVRAKLRELKIKKEGRAYDFGSAKEADRVVKKITAKAA